MTAGIVVQLAVDTIAAAGLYGLFALAVALAYKGSGILHLAIGQVAIAGGLVAAALLTAGQPLWLAVIAALAVGAALSAGAERALVAPSLGRPLLAALLLVVAALVLQEILGGIFPGHAYLFPTTPGTFRVAGGGLIHVFDLVTIASVLATGLGTVLVVRAPRMGAALRVTANAPELAERLGVNTAFVRTASFAAGGALAAGTVLLAAGRFPLAAGGGVSLALRGIAAAAAGRMSSPVRIVLAAVLIAGVEVVGDYLIGGGGEFLCDAAAIVLIAVGWAR